MPKDIMIKVKNLVGGYGNTVILNNLDFEIRKGEITVIVGGSGCGKSTLLKHLIGLCKPMAGSAVVHGCDLSNCTEEEYNEMLKKIGVLYQGGALLGSMTVGQNVALPIQEYMPLDKKSIAALVRMKLAMVHLEGFENHLPSEISGGMLKRAGLARAMALNPPLLFFDEPSAGLDPITAADLDQLILKIRDIFSTTMVIVTHELRSIFTVADKVIMLDKSIKGIIATGSPLELKNQSTNPIVKKFFNPELIGKKDI